MYTSEVKKRCVLRAFFFNLSKSLGKSGLESPPFHRGGESIQGGKMKMKKETLDSPSSSFLVRL